MRWNSWGISASLEMRNGGGGFAANIMALHALPPSSGRRCPEGAEVGDAQHRKIREANLNGG